MLYVVTAAHNRKESTTTFVQSLIAQSYDNWKLILVDDGSTDGTGDAVKAILNNNCILIHGNGNLWWGGSLHEAYKWLKKNASNYDVVLICNDDITLPNDFLENGINHLRASLDSFVTGNGYSIHSGGFLDGVLLADLNTGGHKLLPPGSTGNKSSTRALFLRVSDMKRVGGFHPILLPHYGSDYEYTIRASRKGITIRSFPDLNYSMDERKTGYKGRESINMRNLFSKKSQFNPIYKLTYIILTTPLFLIPKRIIKTLFK